ncbi:otoraplin-like isoform X3 [Pseudoliparis swirei]|uniref:otoraplin-like isoform X3 n=1 Tax=Pseudoliparis swirei TaxID=2059687 RepID=UPI0024BD6191|nr:otoraplin-like isoform X3 [Pseudoliparis swirei]
MTYSLGILLCVGLLHPIVRAIRMDKLADTKICGDAECSSLGDFTAPDCRFINIKTGQMVYVYSKLIPEEGAGVFWSGSQVYSERYVHQMGIIGYFPATMVKETQKFIEDEVKIPTTTHPKATGASSCTVQNILKCGPRHSRRFSFPFSLLLFIGMTILNQRSMTAIYKTHNLHCVQCFIAMHLSNIYETEVNELNLITRHMGGFVGWAT